MVAVIFHIYYVYADTYTLEMLLNTSLSALHAYVHQQVALNCGLVFFDQLMSFKQHISRSALADPEEGDGSRAAQVPRSFQAWPMF